MSALDLATVAGFGARALVNQFGILTPTAGTLLAGALVGATIWLYRPESMFRADGSPRQWSLLVPAVARAGLSRDATTMVPWYLPVLFAIGIVATAGVTVRP